MTYGMGIWAQQAEQYNEVHMVYGKPVRKLNVSQYECPIYVVQCNGLYTSTNEQI